MAKKVFGTQEWAEHTRNIISGCDHDCKYCYSKEMAIRFKRKTPQTWKEEELNHKKLNERIKKYDGKIMYPSAHDITPINIETHLKYLSNLLNVGNELLVVTKPHYTCIKKLCETLENYKDQILFRFTVGSPNTKILHFWEPNAPGYAERKKSIQYAYEQGYNTSISVEPMLDKIDNIKKLVDDLLPSVSDSIWIGKPNFLKRRVKMNGELTPEAMKKIGDLDEWCSDTNIKSLYKDLKKNKKIKWKESIKKVIGLDIPTKAGLDI